MTWKNYVLQYNDKNYPLVCTARAIMDNRCLMQSMEHTDMEGKHKAQQWLWGEKGDDYPTSCLYVNHCTVTNISSLLKMCLRCTSRSTSTWETSVRPVPNEFWTGFRARREEGELYQHCRLVSVTSGPWRRPLVSSRSVLAGWRLSQVSLRTESGSLLQVTPSGKFCFHRWLGGSKGSLGYSYPLWISMTASGHLRFLSTKDTSASGTFALWFQLSRTSPIKKLIFLWEKKQVSDSIQYQYSAVMCDYFKGCSDKEVIFLRQFSAPRKDHILGSDLTFSITVAEEFRIALHIYNNLSPSLGDKRSHG